MVVFDKTHPFISYSVLSESGEDVLICCASPTNTLHGEATTRLICLYVCITLPSIWYSGEKRACTCPPYVTCVQYLKPDVVMRCTEVTPE